MALGNFSRLRFVRQACLAASLAALAGPVHAGVKDGVDAWSRGDYEAAVSEWEAPAAAGDADALFNLAQAYRLGRGVAMDLGRAESLYARAAALGHVRAADTYGLMLFQDGRREQALPYIRAAADRGDPRSQYLLGIAYFNGDLVSKDWIRAYALMTNANRQGLPQAAEALVQMDAHISFAERQRGAGLARQLEAEADAALTRQLAAADLSVQAPGEPAVARGPRRVAQAAPTRENSTGAAEAALVSARQASGTQNPDTAGASYARPPAESSGIAIAPTRSQPEAQTSVQVAGAGTTRVPAARPATAPSVRATGGPWKVQLGAFSVAGNADRLWARLASRPELSGAKKLTVPSGRVTRLLAGGYASKAAADSACRALKTSGQDCIVTSD